MKTKPIAAIDIGTNTFRLLIADVLLDSKKNNYTIKEIYSERIIIRLGKGISKNGFIKKEAMSRGIAALKEFSDIISRYHVHKTSAVATSALRNAKNSNEFLKNVYETTGLKIKIISGREEAKKTFSGMLIGIKPPESALMADIGGGSTELIFSIKSKPVLFQSLDLGVVYLADKYMKNDPPLNEDLKQMGDKISREIISIHKPIIKFLSKDSVFIGTAGTVTALAAMTQGLIKYEHGKIHNFKMTIKEVRKIFSDISTINAEERMKYFPFEPARLDIIVPGTLILLILMETFGFKKVTVSDYGLREGILLDLYRKKRNDK